MSFFTNCILARFTARWFSLRALHAEAHALQPSVIICVQVQGTLSSPHPTQTSCVAFNMCTSAKISSPHPTQTSCVAFNMCTSARNVIIPPPHPPQTSCKAFNMCTSARNVIIPPPHPPHPQPKKPKNLRGRSGTRQHKLQYHFSKVKTANAPATLGSPPPGRPHGCGVSCRQHSCNYKHSKSSILPT